MPIFKTNVFKTLKNNFSWLEVSVKKTLLLSIAVTLGWFLFDYLFFVIFQLYLKSMGIIEGQAGTKLSKSHLLIIVISIGILRTLSSSLKSHISNILYQTFLKIYRYKILDQSLNNFTSIKIFESQALFNEVIFQAGQFWQSVTVIVSNLFLLAILSIFSMIRFGFSFIVCSLLTIASYLMLNRFFIFFDRDTKTVVEKSYSLSKFFTETLKNSMFFNVYKLNATLLKIANNQLDSYQVLYAKFSFVQASKSSLPAAIGFIIIIAFCHHYYSINEISADVFLAFFYIFFRIAQLLGEIAGSLHVAKINFNSSIKVQEWIMSYPCKTHEPSTSKPTLNFEIKTIEALNLNFSYMENNTIFKDLNFSFQRGDIIHICGPSGSGKSTLLSILLGLQKKYLGNLIINNISIKDVEDVYSSKISYVGPTPFFIEETILENLLLGHNEIEKISEEDILVLLRSVGLLDEIQMRGGLKSIYSESNPFSTGQTQRLSIVRALLRDPDIIFFDEATANLDNGSELKIKEIIQKIHLNKIIFIISHKGLITDIANKKIQLGTL